MTHSSHLFPFYALNMELLSLQTFLFSTIFFIYLYLYLFRLQPNSKLHPKIPCFKSYPLLGSLPEFVKNRHRFLQWSTQVLSHCPTNTAVFTRPGKINGIITANPLNVEHILKTNFENYPKGPRFINLLQDFLGQGIFNSDGHPWKVQRKTASYEFNTKSLRNFVMDIATVELQTGLLPILKKASETNRDLDLQDLLERFAFNNICKLAFNVDPGCLKGDGTAGSEFMQAFEDAATLSSGRFMYVLPVLCDIKKFLNIGTERKLRNSIKIVHEFADKIIRSRLQERAERKDQDLLSRFLTETENSAEYLRDIVISFILAGRDTTSSSLTWFFWLLCSRPNVTERILQELKLIRENGGKNRGDTFSFDELREMQYLHAAISEALRLYPPVSVDTKACLNDDVWPDGMVIKKGWFATYNAYAMGRMENIWGKDCCDYRPERWLDENGMCKQESPFKFPIFHAGPRVCLGKDMAYIQMKSIAASVIESFKIEVEDKNMYPEYLLSLTLRMKGGLHASVKERFVEDISIL